MPVWDQSQAAIFNLGPGVSTQSQVFTQSHVLRNPYMGPVPSSHFQLGTSPMLAIIPTWDQSHVGILTSNYKLNTCDLYISVQDLMSDLQNKMRTKMRQEGSY